MPTARWLESDSLTNQDIHAALEIGSYTADADRRISVQFFANQVAGGADYIFYATLQINGSGSAYRLVPKTTATVDAGVTAIGGQAIDIDVRSGDVIKVYLLGAAGDTATPDTVVRWFEMAALQPTVPDRTADVAATGEVGLDFTNRLDTAGILPNAAAGAANGLAIVGSAMGKSPATLDWSADVSNPPTIGTSTLDSTAAQAAAAAAITAAGVSTFDPATDGVKLATGEAATIADAVLDAATADHDDAGSVGKAVADAADAADPWDAPVRTLTQTAAAVAAAVSGSTLAITSAVGFAATISGLTIPATWAAILFTLKKNPGYADVDSIVQIRESNPGALSDGLLYLNGAAGTAAQGSLTVDQAAGTVVIALMAVATAQLEARGSLMYDLKLLRSDGEPSILTASTASIALTPTMAVV